MFSPNPFSSGAKRLTTAEELDLIAIYQKSGDNTVIEPVLKSRSAWVQSVISNIPSPGFADMDTVFSDAMLAVFESFARYDSTKAALSTYLWRVVYNSTLTSIKEQDPQAEQFTPELTLDEDIDYSECIENARHVILNAPHDMLNERARKVAHMMLKGYGIPEIASSIGVTKAVASEVVTGLRQYIAWCMVSQRLSAEPLISDEELMQLAERHERATLMSWK
jgi:DNA-directed RNA polymerase specialized sigma24 family protein